MRMVLVAGMLMLALMAAIVGMVSADSMKWEPPAPAVAAVPSAASQAL